MMKVRIKSELIFEVLDETGNPVGLYRLDSTWNGFSKVIGMTNPKDHVIVHEDLATLDGETETEIVIASKWTQRRLGAKPLDDDGNEGVDDESSGR